MTQPTSVPVQEPPVPATQPVPASAAEALRRIAAGTRVRASLPTRVGNRDVAGTDAWQTGTVVAADETALTVRLDRDGTEFRMPLSGIRALQVSQGTVARGQGWQRDATRGAAGGAVAGAVVMGLDYVFQQGRESQREGCYQCDPSDTGILRPTLGRTALVVGAGTLVGGVIGTLVGNTRQRERWQPVNPRAIQVEVTPTTAMVSLRL
jgi:hypothetical protein